MIKINFELQLAVTIAIHSELQTQVEENAKTCVHGDLQLILHAFLAPSIDNVEFCFAYGTGNMTVHLGLIRP